MIGGGEDEAWVAGGRLDIVRDLRSRIAPPVRAADDAIRDHLDRLAKPPGSLGAIEDLALRLARIVGDPPPPLRRRHILVFAADHGVARRGVSAYPADITRQMCALFVAGGAAINVFARAAGAAVTVVDVGVDAPEDPLQGVLARRVRRGTRDLADGPALTAEEVDRALGVGFECATAAARTADVLALGDMGIGNTTAAAAVTAALAGAPADRVVGRGTGIDDARLRRKREIVAHAVARLPATAEPRRVLAEVGGLEIAAIAGATLGAAAARIPVVTDGFIATAGVLAAVALCPDALDYVFASHRSAEPGHDVQLAALGLRPLLDLRMRLGEGTGAALALPVLDAAGAVLREMATLDAVRNPPPDSGPGYTVDSCHNPPCECTRGLPDYHAESATGIAQAARSQQSIMVRTRLVLVTGGARSGKSDYAERLARDLGGDDVTFIATATPDDAEMAARIERHRAERPPAWTTVETPRGAGDAIRDAATSIVLLDCLTLLASNALLDADGDAARGGGPAAAADEAARAAVRAEANSLIRACAARGGAGTVIVVTNEVGLGVVPATRLGRLFRDALGEANRTVAAAADRVVLMVSGVPQTVR